MGWAMTLPAPTATVKSVNATTIRLFIFLMAMLFVMV
jgi:hypothetical protein